MSAHSDRMVEFRSYRLKPGSGAKFHELVSGQSVPLLEEAGIDVVAYGQSLNDTDSYYLVRSFRDIDDLESSQNAFYTSAAWRQGPREEIIQLIATDINIVIRVDQLTINAIRSCHATGPIMPNTTRSQPD